MERIGDILLRIAGKEPDKKQHPMNEVELLFIETYLYWCRKEPAAKDDLKPQVEIGPYMVDFLYKGRYVIEIDGQEHHSSQEQREHDYQRERYLQQHGYTVIRFAAKEVFQNPRDCITNMMGVVYSPKNVWRDYLEEQKLCS